MTDVSLPSYRTPLILVPDSAPWHTLYAAHGYAHLVAYNGGTPTIVTPHVLRDDRANVSAPPVQPQRAVGGVESFVLRFDTTRNAIDDVRVDRTEDAVTITVTPRGNRIDPRDFAFAPGAPRHDAVITIGATAADDLLEDDARTALADVPHHTFPATQTLPCGARLFAVLHTHDALRNAAAHGLLADIVVHTDALRTAGSDVLHICADLLTRGADLQDIMVPLYKKVTFKTLQLWGIFLQHITAHCDDRLLIATVPSFFGNDLTMTAGILSRTLAYRDDDTVVCALWYARNKLNGILLTANNAARTQLRNATPHLTINDAAPDGTLRFRTTMTPEEVAARLCAVLSA